MNKFAITGAFLWSFSAAASYYSCLPYEDHEPTMTITQEAGSRFWNVRFFDRASHRTIGDFEVRRLSDSPNFVSFSSMQIAIQMAETGYYGHRKTRVEAPVLNIRSNKWVCKEIP